MNQSVKPVSFIARLITTTLAVIVVSWLLPGVKIDGVITAILFAIVLALLNVLIKPLLVLLTLPITVLTLGLFLLVINALMILLAAEIVPGFIVDGFWWAVLFSIILSVTVSVLHGLQNAFSGKS
jgi:putative membrane protein